MTELFDDEVSAIVIYQAGKSLPQPWRIKWKTRVFTFREVDLCHPVWEGKELHHIFSVSNGANFFRLDYNTRSQKWHLKEISDGLPS